MIVIGLSGYAASGKTEAANYLKEKYNFTILEFSQIVEEEGRKLGLIKGELGLEEKKRLLSEIGAIIRRQYNDEAIFAKLLVKKVLDEGIDKAVVTGFRAAQEVLEFKKSFKENFYLIWLETDVRLRYERRKLQDPSFSLSFEEFLERDKNDSRRLGLDKVKELSDFSIENNSSLEDLKKKLDEIMKQVI